MLVIHLSEMRRKRRPLLSEKLARWHFGLGLWARRVSGFLDNLLEASHQVRFFGGQIVPFARIDA